MGLGSIEMVVFGFPDGAVHPDVRTAVTAAISGGSVNLVDALLLRKQPDGEVVYRELDELTDDADIVALANSITDGVDLLAEEDADELAAELAPGESALVLLFERAWMQPIIDAAARTGGLLIDDIPIPSTVVEEVASAVEGSFDNEQGED